MFKLRKQQEETLRQGTREHFEDYLVEYLYATYPEEYQPQNPADVYEFVRYGIEVADCYGITSEQLVFYYIQLMVALGADFDQDPDLPWAQEILLDTDLSQEDVLAHLIAQAAPDGAGVPGNADSRT